jgi:hypothetical protein
VDSRISRGGSNLDGHIWILTLKRIYAEGLQQIIPKICLSSMTRNWLRTIRRTGMTVLNTLKFMSGEGGRN